MAKKNTNNKSKGKKAKTNKKENVPTNNNQEKKPIVKQGNVGRPPKLVLRFSSYAWQKLLWFRDKGNVNQSGHEIGGYGITLPSDPLAVIDFITIEQDVSAARVAFREDAIMQHLEDMIELNIEPRNCARVWIHTHPQGMSASPSSTDETTFATTFGGAAWAVMFILNQTGDTTTRIRWKEPPNDIEITCSLDWTLPSKSSDFEAWEKEFDAHMFKEAPYVHSNMNNYSSLYRPPHNGHGYYANKSWNQKNQSWETKGGVGQESFPFPETTKSNKSIGFNRTKYDLQYDAIEDLYHYNLAPEILLELEKMDDKTQEQALDLLKEDKEICVVEGELHYYVYEEDNTQEEKETNNDI